MSGSIRFDSARFGLIRAALGSTRFGDAHLETVTNRVIGFVLTWYLARRELAVYEASDANRAGFLSSLFSRRFINKRPLHLVPFRSTATRVAPSSYVRKRVPLRLSLLAPWSISEYRLLTFGEKNAKMSATSCYGILRSLGGRRSPSLAQISRQKDFRKKYCVFKNLEWGKKNLLWKLYCNYSVITLCSDLNSLRVFHTMLFFYVQRILAVIY